MCLGRSSCKSRVREVDVVSFVKAEEYENGQENGWIYIPSMESGVQVQRAKRRGDVALHRKTYVYNALPFP